MILFSLLLIPLLGVFILLCKPFMSQSIKYNDKVIALFVTTINFLLSLKIIKILTFTSITYRV